MKQLSWFFFFISFFVLSPGQAQEQYVSQKHSISIPDGLLSNNVTIVYEDSRGIVWIGTDCGLNRYDGINLEIYTKKNGALKGNYVKKILEDVHGNIWINCPNEFGGFSQLSIIDFTTQKSLPEEILASITKNFDISKVTKFTENYDHSILLTSSPGSLFHEYDGDSIQFLVDLGIKPSPTTAINYERKLNDSTLFLLELHSVTEVVEQYTSQTKYTLYFCDLKTQKIVLKRVLPFGDYYIHQNKTASDHISWLKSKMSHKVDQNGLFLLHFSFGTKYMNDSTKRGEPLCLF